MKKIVFAIAAGLLSITTVQAHAADEKVVAIIDYAIDSTKFKNIAYEACFTGNGSCPNKKNFQEGPGSAMTDNWSMFNGKMAHGHNVVQTAVLTDPNVKIVFIRVGDRNAIIEENSLINAIAWLSKNYSNYSIDAVSLSLSRKVTTCPSVVSFNSSVAELSSANVPVFSATGNDGQKSNLGWPSCVSGIVPVSDTLYDGNQTPSGNFSDKVKIVAPTCVYSAPNKCIKIADYFGVSRANSGTSIATPIAATRYVSAGIPISDWLTILPKQNTYAVVK